MTNATNIHSTQDAAAPARRAVVHVGTVKTGSTTIQAWLARNAGYLRQRGVVFDRLRTMNPRRLSHVHGFSSLAPQLGGPSKIRSEGYIARRYRMTTPQGIARATGDFKRRAEHSFAKMKRGTYVISSELIEARLRDEAQVAALDGWLTRHFDRVEYVVYVRSQIAWVASLYSQSLKLGATHGLDDFVEKRGRHDLNALYQRWAGAVGADRFHLRLLERDALTDGDLIADLSNIIGVDPSGAAEVRTMNTSFDEDGIDAMLRFNRATRSLPYFVSHVARQFVIARCTRGAEKARTKLPADQARAVYALNADSNETLRRTCFPSRPVLFTSEQAFAPKSAEPLQ